ncbi:hypothetical protein ACJRO7_015034 [Eucalyptus globulus]|uniref:DUF7477 domain-containing protein n=1 Tax=Eucalyptus globulus TaxID=34317 RepID=A0ABD3L3A5_EUCGL
MATPLDMPCDACPGPYLQFTASVLDLKFDEEPNYAEYISLFHGITGQNIYVWPVHRDASQEVPCEQVQLKDDDEPSKRTRIGLKLKQWMSVYHVHLPMKQRYLSNSNDVDLPLHIQKGRAKGIHVASVASGPLSKSWAIIMDDGVGYTAQTYAISFGYLPEDWIRAHRSQSYYITIVAGAADHRFLVIRSKGWSVNV